ncbi:ribonuclease H-like domain-containing protein [Tirmania nivea]|nr:ribonuclease H-like domain-containing protein [Tirmania nivea]
MYALIQNASRGLSRYSQSLLGTFIPVVTTNTCRSTIIDSNTVCRTPLAAPDLTPTSLSASKRQHFHTAGPRQVSRPYLRQLRARSTPGKFTDTPINGSGRPSIFEDMQVTRLVFEEQKSQLLENLRRSIFVAFDLEFSGLQKPKEGGKHVAERSRGKMTLQECYASTRKAVETYQLLQVGLCPVEWKEEDETYVASPVNIYVNPIVSPSLGVDRVFSLQSSTLAFLIEHGFDFNTQLRHGVSYLSREEETKVIDSWSEEDRNREVLTIDSGSQQFADDCIKALEEWENDPDAPWDFINITTDRNIMSNYQRYIVHQIVRTRFPKLTSQGKGTFVCVTRQTEEQMGRKKAETRDAFDAQLNSAIGLRHIIDELFEPKRPDGRKIILVGHNCFTDLLHLYNCFIGKLPEKVEEFAELMSKSFPILIDTKYLATYGDDTTTANSGSTLHILESLLRPQTNPKIELHAEYNTYGGDGHAFHEAGYDAYITATILIRVAARLAHEGGWQLTPPQLQIHQTEQPPHHTNNVARDVASEAKDYVPMELDSQTSGLKDHGVGLAETMGMVEVVSQQSQPNQRPIPFLSLGASEDEKFHDDVKAIPGFYGSDNSKFWEPYVNKLRIFNTDEGVLKLPGKRNV